MRHFPLAVASAVMAVAATTATARAAPETYPLSKVRPGQTGYGYTTMRVGGGPEKFTFEVISVAKNFLPRMDIILVKSADPKVQHSGFWAGMSGSPLYLDDKLVCAFSYGFRFNKSAIGGCTPIQYMKDEARAIRRAGPATVKPAAKPRGKAAVAAPPTTPQAMGSLAEWRRLTPTGDVATAMGPPRSGASFITQQLLPPPVAPAKVDDQVMTAAVPMSLAGFSAPAFAEVEKLFAGYNVTPLKAGGTGGSADAEAPSKLEMGGSFSVVLIRGDMSAAATCTVSYIDANRMLGCGHPIFQAGEIYAPITTTKVHTVIPSAMQAFVMASPGKEVGSLVQDRQSMVMAETGLKDPMIPIDVLITTATGKKLEKTNFHVEILDNKFFTGSLVGAAAMSAIQYVSPDRDHVTAKIDSTVKIKGYGELTFTDYLYANDGASSVVSGARGLRAINPLLLNPFAPIEIERVEVKVDMRYAADYGEIKEIQLPSQTLPPGKRSTVRVVLDRYDGTQVIDDVPVDVPASLAGSIVQLEVTSGDSAKLDAPPPVDVKTLLAALRKMLPGNVWTATLSVADEGIAIDGVVVKDLPGSAHDKLHPAARTQRVQSYKPIARTTAPAKRVLNGSASVLVRIADK